MIPNQSPDNPYNILSQRVEWVGFEYQAGRGSRLGLVDYAKRFFLMTEIVREHGNSPALIKAMAYLLEMGKEIQ